MQFEEIEEALHITEGDDADDNNVAPVGAQNDLPGDMPEESSEVAESSYDHPYERAL